MDNSNKAIARRINKELKIRGWKQTDLLKKIIKFKYPNISNSELYTLVIKSKGNFSTTLKGNNRSIPKDDLYIISKIFGVPLEYVWFGDEKKSGFIPNGARYAAYQDNDSEYNSYIANLKHEDDLQLHDEFGFNLFDYFGQFESINGYKYFLKNYRLYFDYVHYGQLMYINSEGHSQFCSSSDDKNTVSDNLLMTLIKHNDTKTFKSIYFDNCPLQRFDNRQVHYGEKKLFSDSFLEAILRNESFLDFTLTVREIELNSFNKYYDKGEKRRFIEPMFYEVLFFALEHEKEYKNQLMRMLHFVIEYSKSQYEFIKNYLKTQENEYGDVRIIEYAPRFLESRRKVPMGNVFIIKEKLSDNVLVDLIKEIEQITFNMTHIINKQEKSNDEIKISTPDNQLFIEISKVANERNANFIPRVLHLDKEFTHFQYYESLTINYDNNDHLQSVVEYLNKAQNLVTTKQNKVLVHGNLSGAVFMVENGKVVGLAGWQKCHYGSKFEDRAELLSNIDDYSFRGEFLEGYKTKFDIISQGFTQEEKVKLIDKTINLLAEKRNSVLENDCKNISTAYHLKERSSKIEFFKEFYLNK